MTTAIRENLGDFSSIICLKSLIVGMEDALGEKATAIAMIAAGRKRGKSLVNSLGLANSHTPTDKIAECLDSAIGKNGTRLTTVNKVEQEDGVIKVYCSETVCSAGEELGSDRKCTFTLGAVWGALEALQNQRLQGIHTESVLRGGSYDVFEFRVIS